jgi:zinc transporter ZupT
MMDLLDNPWVAGVIVFVTQIIFLYFRTLNVIYNAQRDIIRTIVTGNIIGITWLISIAIGTEAIMTLQWQPILGYFLGGTAGTYFGLKRKK